MGNQDIPAYAWFIFIGVILFGVFFSFNEAFREFVLTLAKSLICLGVGLGCFIVASKMDKYEVIPLIIGGVLLLAALWFGLEAFSIVDAG